MRIPIFRLKPPLSKCAPKIVEREAIARVSGGLSPAQVRAVARGLRRLAREMLAALHRRLRR
jgi:hypothetical protein